MRVCSDADALDALEAVACDSQEDGQARLLAARLVKAGAEACTAEGIAAKFGNTLTVVNPGCGFAEIAAAQKLQVRLALHACLSTTKDPSPTHAPTTPDLPRPSLLVNPLLQPLFRR